MLKIAQINEALRLCRKRFSNRAGSAHKMNHLVQTVDIHSVLCPGQDIALGLEKQREGLLGNFCRAVVVSNYDFHDGGTIGRIANDQDPGGAERAHVAHEGVFVRFCPGPARSGDGVEKFGDAFRRESEQAIAFLQGEQVLRLSERNGVAFAAPQAIVTRRRSFDDFDAEIVIAQPAQSEQLARRDRDRASLISEPDGSCPLGRQNS